MTAIYTVELVNLAGRVTHAAEYSDRREACQVAARTFANAPDCRAVIVRDASGESVYGLSVAGLRWERVN